MLQADWSEAVCHCGAPAYVYEDGFSRGMCESCSTVRCDLPGVPCPIEQRKRPLDESKPHVFELTYRVRGAGANYWSTPVRLQILGYDLPEALRNASGKRLIDWYRFTTQECDECQRVLRESATTVVVRECPEHGDMVLELLHV